MKTDKFIFIAGPCVIESKRMVLNIAARLKGITSEFPCKFVFKASFDKANRTGASSFRGPGVGEGLGILEEVKRKYNLPVLSDVHCVSQVARAKDILDIIQIPAFLCRQTDLVLAAAETKKIVNIKKGQFLAPWDVKYIIEKIESTGNKKIIVTERGVSFGYNNLTVDFRSFLWMKEFGYPVVYDVTHSLQKPSAAGGVSGGDRQFVEPMSLAGTACGIDGLFMEVHPNPQRALSDKYTSFNLGKVKNLLKKIFKVREAVSRA